MKSSSKIEEKAILDQYCRDSLDVLIEIADSGDLQIMEYLINHDVEKKKYLKMMHDIMNGTKEEELELKKEAAKRLYDITSRIATAKGVETKGVLKSYGTNSIS